METISTAEMRALEHAAIASSRTTGLELMERAGQGVVQAILEEWPDLEGQERGASPSSSIGRSDQWRTQGRPPRYFQPDEGATRPPGALVLCGPGNNGGDGFVVARLLQQRGWKVEAVLYGDPEGLPPDAAANFARCEVPVTVRGIDPAPLMDDSFNGRRQPDILLDALFGIGLNRPMRGITGVFTASQDMQRDHGLRVVAVDIPSGLNADSGQPIGKALKADLTVTFHRAKPGHLIGRGTDYCGKLVIKDIGL